VKAFLLFSIIAFTLLAGLFSLQNMQKHDGKLRIIFCDVGQGDAILITTPNGSDILFDGGPNKQVLACLSEHLAFWDRDIEMMFLSHPHTDHLIGLIDVIERYSLGYFAREELANTTDEYKMLLAKVREAGARQKIIYAGDRLKLADGVVITVVGPTKAFLERTTLTIV
jgi:competence protein ComEC